MGMTIEGQVGPRVVADGSSTELRQSRMGGLVTTDAHGRYYEPASRQMVFVASTPVAGVAPGTALSTTPPWALWNPPSSGVLLGLLKAQLGYVSGTLGAGTVVYAYVSSQATIPTGGTEITPICMNLSATRGRGRAFQGSTLASTPLLLKPCISLTTFVITASAADTVPQFSMAQDEIAGEIVVPPGSVLVMQGVAAAGTTPLLMFSGSWEEVTMASATS